MEIKIVSYIQGQNLWIMGVNKCWLGPTVNWNLLGLENMIFRAHHKRPTLVIR